VEFEESKTRSEEGILRSLRTCVQKHVARSFFLGSGLGFGRRRDSVGQHCGDGTRPTDSETTGLGRHCGDGTRPTLVRRQDSADTCTATGLGRHSVVRWPQPSCAWTVVDWLVCLLVVANPANLRAGRTRRTCGRGEPGEPAGGANPANPPPLPPPPPPPEALMEATERRDEDMREWQRGTRVI
jgi:hypothetical protein